MASAFRGLPISVFRFLSFQLLHSHTRQPDVWAVRCVGPFVD